MAGDSHHLLLQNHGFYYTKNSYMKLRIVSTSFLCQKCSELVQSTIRVQKLHYKSPHILLPRRVRKVRPIARPFSVSTHVKMTTALARSLSPSGLIANPSVDSWPFDTCKLFFEKQRTLNWLVK